MLVNLMPEITAGLTGSIDWNDLAHLLIVKSHLSSTFLLISKKLGTILFLPVK
jgi:hypothetical protein